MSFLFERNLKIKEAPKKEPKRQRRSDLDYKEIPKKKTEPDKIDQVVVYLKSHESGKFTRLGRRFARIARLDKLIKQERKNLTVETRAEFDALFDAADDVYTRVIETTSLIFKMGKAETRTKTEFNNEAWMNKLSELTGMAVDDLEEIRKTFESSTDVPVDPKVLPPKEKEQLKENSEIDSTVAKIQSHLGYYDELIDELDAELDIIEGRA